jgi:hypothetical protein
MRSRRPVSLLLPALALAAPLAAQRPSPDDYLAYLPPTPCIVARTAATSQLRLYGDPETPGYLDVDTRELTSGVTYRLPPTESEALRVYLRGGYAWTDYSLRAVTLNAEPLPDADRRGGYMLTLLPSRRWWPNTAYAGLGLEGASPTHRWLLQRVAYGLRLGAPVPPPPAARRGLRRLPRHGGARRPGHPPLPRLVKGPIWRTC